MVPNPWQRSDLRRRDRLFVLALAGATCLSTPALAQQVDLLRGAVSERATNEQLLGRGQTPGTTNSTASAGLESPPYQPSSPGALDPISTGTTAAAPAGTTPFDTDAVTRPASEGIRARDAQRRQPAAGVAAPREVAPATTAAVDELPTGTVRASAAPSDDEERNVRAGPENTRTGAIEGLDRRPDDEPYGAVGLRAGTFIFKPTLEQGIGWTSNSSNSAGGRASTYSQTGLRLEALSDWSRHSAAVRADGTFRRSLAGDDISDLEGGIDADLRFDLGNEYSATAGLGYRVKPEAASSPNSVDNAVTEPLRQTLTGSLGLSKDLGKLRLGVTGDVARDVFGDAQLEGGGVLDQGDRNSTLGTVRIRGGYEISPALRPFVEAEYGRRFYDQRLDGEGYARSADRYGLRGGFGVDLGEKLTGEIAAGWLTERPDDDRLAAISGASVQGNLAWSPVRGTTVELNAGTQVEGSTRAGETGSLLYSGSLAVSRELRSDLTGRALVGLDLRDYAGSGERDLVARGELSLTWWLNRYAGVTGRVGHEVQRSTLADRDYDSTSVYLGMTFQR